MAKKIKVAVNFGHGDTDSGAVGNGLKEKDLTKAIGKRITKLLRDNYDVVVKEIRQSQSGGGLTQITNEANNWGADIFVSIHINSGGGTGFESFIFNGNVSNDTKKLQNAIHDAVIKEIGVTDRGKKTANFAVLRQTQMPAVLTENMFIDTKADADKLKDGKFLDKVAQGHVNGIVSFLGLKGGSSQSKPKPKPSKPATDHTKPAKKKANLTVDGKWGKGTTKALQRSLGTTADGIISGQPRNSVSTSLYGGTVTHNTNNGSPMVKALQSKIKVNADGKLGPATVRALQRHLGTPIDGVLSRPSVVVGELQRRLNAGTF